MSLKLKQTRQSIDKIDREITKLINKRALLALDAAKVKNGTYNKGDTVIYVPSREREVLKKVTSIKGILEKEALKNIYTEIISACRNLEKLTKVAFLGPWASFTHQAAIRNFGSSVCFVPVATAQEVITEIESGRVSFGVVPVENSNEGSVNIVLDTFVETELKICAEVSLKIEQCFLVKESKSKIVRIYSHPHALAQCNNWVTKNYPDVELISVCSTAEAAKKIAKEGFAAAIASEAAAKMYNLRVLQKGIQDNVENFTRFFVIGKSLAKPSGGDKTSLIFMVKNKVGALHNILGIFSKHNVDLTKIESRPTKKKAWEYVFFIDFKGHVNDKSIMKMVKILKQNCVFMKILGSYPIAWGL
ncbi:MAG: prephenate dehydratase [Endomicrobium sp.]|nr:prephenate dehydratase [Endomicrobium sp.]